MTVTTSYPGVYIQELPSLAHTIEPAPTSIAAFVGFTHPFLTQNFADTNPPGPTPAVLLSSFADYQANFGGFFYSPWQPDYVGQAVFQFFQNGGPACYVVGLPALQFYNRTTGTVIMTGTSPVPVTQASLLYPTDYPSITFTAQQPVGVPGTTPDTWVGIPMQVAFSNFQSTATSTPQVYDVADVVISYGTTVETYRRVAITDLVTTLESSKLVTVTGTPPAEYQLTQGSLPQPDPGPFPFLYDPGMVPRAAWTVINPGPFGRALAPSASLDKVPIFNLLVTPGITDNAVTSEAVSYCERKRAFYIMDTPSPSVPAPPFTTPPTPTAPLAPEAPWDVDDLVQEVTTLSPAPPVSINAAIYYPWLVTTDPVTGASSTAPPSGFVAGIYGQEDSTFGVWKSPAGIETALLGTPGVDPNGVMTDIQQGILNQNAFDCLRQFPGIGTVVFGARTTAATDLAYQQWMYVAVRRTALFIEQSLYASLTWAVFQGNAAPLWKALTQEVTAFMLTLFRQGAFAGDTPSDAFLVQCDSTTTTATDVANGRVNILVGFAPLVPAEFVVVQIAQLAGQAQS
jgi:uncharacterized protein